MNILLVDDHALFRGGLKFLLQQLDDGLVLDEAGNCPQALEHAAKRRYDLVLLDLNMPGLSRLDALAARREDAHDAKSIVLNDGSELNDVRDAESMNSGDGVTIVGARLEEKNWRITVDLYRRSVEDPTAIVRQERKKYVLD